jgi:hypothetical protein
MSDVDNAALEKLRGFAREQAAIAADLRIEVRHLQRDNKRLTRRLDRVYRSWTWRLGRVVLFPYYVVAWLLNRISGRRKES